jgi:mRNA-degrading endonuclease toxin of MazEF toxin-antitoxin module
LGGSRSYAWPRAGEASSLAIVSVDQLNRASLGLSLAVPLTRTDFGSPLHVEVPASEAGLKERGFAMPEQPSDDFT